MTAHRDHPLIHDTALSRRGTWRPPTADEAARVPGLLAVARCWTCGVQHLLIRPGHAIDRHGNVLPLVACGVGACMAQGYPVLKDWGRHAGY